MAYLVLIRHGESTYNEANLFTGWTDCPLTEKGKEEAKKAGILLKSSSYSQIDYVITSVLNRAIESTEIILKSLGLAFLKINEDYRFNERHYGALEGFNKAEIKEKLGYDTVYKWRRTYEGQPPLLKKSDKRNPVFSPLYKGIDPQKLPLGESLKQTAIRVNEGYEEKIVPELKLNHNVLLVAHANSLRGLVMKLDKTPEEKAPDVYLPTAVPLIYTFDSELNVIRKEFLGNPKDIKEKIEKSLYKGWHYRN